jgi:hypothetical protein
MRQYATNFYDYLQKRNISMRRSQLLYDWRYTLIIRDRNTT